MGINILKTLKEFGLNPVEWSIQKLQNQGGQIIVWFQAVDDHEIQLKGTFKSSLLSELEWVCV